MFDDDFDEFDFIKNVNSFRGEFAEDYMNSSINSNNSCFLNNDLKSHFIS